ncbi:uncharacterized protein [Panulirus ornatus]|uniref:uncharacterized protein n=1 Tax=Panulirus ornatus TaxID=150431 RepID=UPI003A83BA6D
MTLVWLFLLTLLPMGTGAEAKTRSILEERVVVDSRAEEVWRQVGMLMGQVVKQHLVGCHLVLAINTNTQHSPVFYHVLRRLAAEVETGLVVEIGSLLSQDAPSHDHLLQGLWGDGSSTCHALILDYTDGDAHSTVRFLEKFGLWLRPETQVVVVGRRPHVSHVLLHPVFRNTLHALYLVLHHTDTLRQLTRTGSSTKGNICPLYVARRHRCYPENFAGHEFEIVDKNYFPYFSFERSSDVPGARVYPTDSLITRMLNTIVPKLNFTHFIREPLDGQWGVPGDGGNWTGIVGELQHHQGDLALDLTVTSQRATVVDFTRIYIDEPVAILSSKPRPLPEYLSLIRPFEGKLWVILLVSIVVWGMTLWLLQKAWSWASGGRGLNLSSALFYSWGAMLQDPPNKPPRNVTAQVLVGWWLVFCLVVTTAYRSSLISHLVVQGKSPVINSAEDLVSREGWSWGTPRMTGALLSYLRSSPNPAILKMYHGMQADSIDEGMNLVLQGGYSFIYNKYYARTLIATRFTDDIGYTPIHISATEYPLFAGDAWACRRGAPFRRRLDLTIQRLLEAGLIAFWMDDVIATHVRNNRKKTQESLGSGANIIYQRDDGQVVLGLHHLQVTFYLLLLSYSLSFVVFLTEKFFHSYHSPQTLSSCQGDFP